MTLKAFSRHGDLLLPLDHGTDAVIGEKSPKLGAPSGLDLIVLVDVEPIGIGIGPGRERQIVEAGQRVVVHGRDLAPAGNVAIVGRELVAQHRRLHVIEPAVGAPGDDAARFVAAVIAQQGDGAADLVVVGDQRAGVAEAAERLGGIEAERAEGAKGAGLVALVA